MPKQPKKSACQLRIWQFNVEGISQSKIAGSQFERIRRSSRTYSRNSQYGCRSALITGSHKWIRYRCLCEPSRVKPYTRCSTTCSAIVTSAFTWTMMSVDRDRLTTVFNRARCFRVYFSYCTSATSPNYTPENSSSLTTLLWQCKRKRLWS